MEGYPLDAPDLTQLVSKGFQRYFPQLALTIQNAYNLAKNMGRRGDECCYAPPLEAERIADEQGRAAQNALFRFAERNPDLEAGWGENSRKLPHVEIRAGTLLMTAHRVSNPGDFPRHAIYRQQKALSNYAFLPGLDPAYDPSNPIYLHLLHGPAREDRYGVGFIQLGVPAPDGKSWLLLLNISREQQESTEQEEIRAKQLATLKPRKEEKDED